MYDFYMGVNLVRSCKDVVTLITLRIFLELKNGLKIRLVTPKQHKGYI